VEEVEKVEEEEEDEDDEDDPVVAVSVPEKTLLFDIIEDELITPHW